MRNKIAIILLFMSWPVCLINRIWNKAPDRVVNWTLFEKDAFEDFRWYITQSELAVSAIFVLVSVIVMKQKTRNYKIVLWALFWVSMIDVVNYWLWFRRNEYALTLEGLIMLTATYIILTHDSKRTNEKTR